MKYFVLIASTLVSTTSLCSMYTRPTITELPLINKEYAITIINDLPDNSVFNIDTIGVKDAYGPDKPCNWSGRNIYWNLKPNAGLKLSSCAHEKYFAQSMDSTKKPAIDLHIPAALYKQYIRLHFGEGTKIQFGDTIVCQYNFNNQNIQLILNKATILKELQTIHSTGNNQDKPCHVGLIK
ncbi:MAG TPA: hypothetical protein VKR54_01160 [Candidatus Babeliales bacterium]|jgi:hypothetical protein|nr:hypothetical protein [Candidatus Babeliales bacterium]